MTKEKKPNELRNYFIMVLLFVISIVTLGISFSYAYFAATFSGEDEITNQKAANLNISSTLTSANAINAEELGLIKGEEYQTKGKKVAFTITNNDKSTEEKEASNVNAYYTIKLVEMSLSKNLFSKYFKWALVKVETKSSDLESEESTETRTVIASGDFTDSGHEEGTKIQTKEETIVDEEGNEIEKKLVPMENEIVSGLSKELITVEKAKLLKVGDTVNLEFYIWLENDDEADQLYLTAGSFSGKLSMDAYPTKDTVEKGSEP